MGAWKHNLLLTGLFLVCSGSAYAQLYKCEEQGKVSYSDTRCDEKKGAKMNELPLSTCSARSANELKSKFERAFRAKDEAGFYSLFSWHGVSSELQSQLKREFSNILSKELIRAELRDASSSEKMLTELEASGMRLNIVPANTLYFERSIGPKITDPREKTSGQFAIGRQGSCFVIGAYVKK